jgi:oxygen-dependent protoporphyrinogen oxidase
LDPPLARALLAIPYSGVSLIALAYRVQDIPRPLDGYGYLVTRAENLATLGVAWESSLFPGRAPQGHALLRVFMGGARRPALVDQPAEAVIRQAREELCHLMGIQAAPARAWQFAWPQAIAQYTVGHLARVADIRDRVRQHAGLAVCGTSYDGVSFNHAIATGRRHARLLAEEIESNAERAA